MRLCALLLVLWTAIDAGPSIPYFSKVRVVRVSAAAEQNYIVVDEEIWQHARPDLADLRLFDGASQLPYALIVERGGISSAETEAKILNLGSVAGQTEFDIDAGGLPEYDRIHLRLEAKNFVATAHVVGNDAPGQNHGTALGSATLYDFSTENLGSNFTLKLHPVSFRYLHVRITDKVRPQHVKGAGISNLQEQRARWVKFGGCDSPHNEDRITVISCNVPARVPVDRIQFDVDPQQFNFRRTVSIAEAQALQVASGEVGRVKMKRGGMMVTSEDLAIDLGGQLAGPFTVTVDNADNPPLRITEVQPLAIERRVYFDPQGKSKLNLYYGDRKLAAPSYDYARFFHADAAAQAELGPGTQNSAYTGRPDERPWSERHRAILWIAMLAAVAVLALLAVRGLLAQPKTQA
jgi:hypothetical protein